MTYKEFRSLTAESVTFLDAGKKKRAGDGEEAEGEKKPVLTAKLWQSDMRRKGANTDRRWRVVAHEKAPRPAGDYEQLYAALDNPEFINAVGVFLRERDISGFKPGERPPLSAAKAAVIEASKPMQTSLAEDLRDHWPADIILNDHVAEILADHPDADYTPAMRRAMEEIGAVAIEQQLKINGRAQRGWILRNTESWRSASKGAQRQETYRAGVSSLRPASAVFADAMDDEPPI